MFHFSVHRILCSLASREVKSVFLVIRSRKLRHISDGLFPNVNFRHHLSTRSKEAWNIIFYGTDNFSLKALKVLNENLLGKSSPRVVKHLEVVCLKNVKSIVENYAEKQKLPYHHWPFSVPEGLFDVGVVASFGHLIPETSIRACRYGMLNIHGSLLPRWRGASPIIHTILNRDKVAGVTIMEIAPKKFDIGKLVMQEKYDLSPEETSQHLYEVLGNMGSKMLMVCLENLQEYLQKSQPQPNEGITHAPKLTPEMGRIKWTEQSVADIDCLYRALSGFVKIYSEWHGQQIKLHDMVKLTHNDIENLTKRLTNITVAPGYSHFHKPVKALCVKCKDGWVAFKEVVLTGRKKMTAQDFHNGFLTKVPQEQWYLGCLFSSS